MPVAEKLATASDLARKSAQILDEAAKGPVSIPREKEKPAITLVRRDRWQQAECAEHWMIAFSSIVRFCLALIAGETDGYPQEWEWLRAFEAEDLTAFLTEFSEAMSNAVHGTRSWDEVEDVLHEWHHGALALVDNELAGRFRQARAEFEE